MSETVPDEGPQPLRSERQGAGTVEIERLFGEQVFTFPKPSSLIRELVRATTVEGDLVLDFFAGSGTTGAAVLSLNADDDAGRRFILVSNTEATDEQPEKNLCRDVCAGRLSRVIAGQADGGATPDDFAYLRVRRMGWDDVVYDLDPAATWTLLQLRHTRSLRPFDVTRPLQWSPPDPRSPGESGLAYAPEPTAEAAEALRDAAVAGPVIAFCPVPGTLRDLLGVSAIPVEQVPGRLLSEFPTLVAGL